MRRFILMFAAIATMALPAVAADRCVATFVAPTTAVYYVQLGEGVTLYDLDAGESVTFWEVTTPSSWAAWYAVTDDEADPTFDAGFRAVPGDLVDSGEVGCDAPADVPADRPVAGDAGLVVGVPSPVAEAPVPVAEAGEYRSPSAGVYPI